MRSDASRAPRGPPAGSRYSVGQIALEVLRMAFADRQSRKLGASTLAALLGIAACPLSASSVPAAEYAITLNMGTPHTVPGSFVQGGALGEIEPQPAPVAFAHVAEQGTSHAQMQYWFRVNGPSPNVQVPIHIDGHIEISAGNAEFEEDMIWGVSAQMSAQALDGPFGQQGVAEIDNDTAGLSCNPNSVGPIPVPLPIPSCSATVQDEPVLLTLTVLSGADNRVTLFAAANNQELFAADFEARVDPVISFAPGFDATGYSIELSDGVGNTVPEPGAALMTCTGAGALLLLRRRKAAG
jgi:hypothetical protein